MVSWASIAVTAALSVILSFVFLLASSRGVRRMFGPRSTRWATGLIAVTAAASTGLGVILAVTDVHIDAIYLGLVLPIILWLSNPNWVPGGGQEYGQNLLSAPLRRLYDRMGDDMQEWNDARLKAVAGRPDWVSDAASYYYRQVVTRQKGEVPGELGHWAESIAHKASVVRLINLDVPQERLLLALRSHSSTSNLSRYEIDDYPRLAERLEFEAFNELSLLLGRIYRLGYRRLPVYSPGPAQPAAARPAWPGAPAPAESGRPEGGIADAPARRDEEAVRDAYLDDLLRRATASQQPSYPVLSDMAHHMKTPLAQLLAFIKLHEADSEGGEDTVGGIKDSVDMCVAMLRAYSDLAHVSDQVEPEAGRSLGDSLQRYHRIYADQAAKKTELQVEVPRSVPGYTNYSILAILAPLLQNAVEASPDTIISVTSEEDSAYIQFTIRNYLAQPVYENALDTRGLSSKPGHDGLGISAVRRLVSYYKNASAFYEVGDEQFAFHVRLPRRSRELRDHSGRRQ